jgi:hypothetical protein
MAPPLKDKMEQNNRVKMGRFLHICIAASKFLTGVAVSARHADDADDAGTQGKEEG